MGGDRKHVLIAIPTYSGSVSIATLTSLMPELRALWSRDDIVEFADDCGSTDICLSRAILLRRFLDSKATHLMCLDNDVAWERGAMLRMIDAKVDLCGGVYPKKTEPVSWPVGYLKDREELRADPEHGLLEVEYVPGGFMRLTRECAEKMVAHYEYCEFRKPSRYDGKLPGVYHPLRLDDDVEITDDMAFCHRWRAMGGKVWTDPDMTFAHMGEKAFVGSLGDWLRKINNVN